MSTLEQRGEKGQGISGERPTGCDNIFITGSHYMEPGLHREMADLSGTGNVRNILSSVPESKKAIKGRWAGNFITGQGSHWTDSSVGQFGWIK